MHSSLFTKKNLYHSQFAGDQNGDVVVARDNEVRDSLTKMMTTKADSGMSNIFHNFPENFSLRTAAFLLVSGIAVVLVLSVSIGLICKVQVIIHHFIIFEEKCLEL